MPTDTELGHSSSNTNAVVKVVCRLRPSLPHEPEPDSSVVEVLGRREIRITDPVKKLVNRFDFSACYDEQSTQQEIFDNEVKQMVLGVFSGVTATIFTFGCTGSGKTHTLQGSPRDPGITPRAVRAIFEHMRDLKSQHGTSAQYITTISCFEIWKDKVWDLLNEAGTVSTRDMGKGDLTIREATNGQVFVSNLRKIPLYAITDFERLYGKAMRSRSTSSTKLNHASSRSHAILNLHITQLRGGRTYEGKCVLIDLAGSENNKKTGNDENRERMKESVEINQSLLTLRKVVRSLNAGETRIPYRDSKLTRILSDSLGGSSVGLVICNIAPNSDQYRDTMNTLNFGSLTRNVENKVAVKDKETVQANTGLVASAFYYHAAMNKSAPQLSLSHSSGKLASTAGCSVPYSYKPRLPRRPTAVPLNSMSGAPLTIKAPAMSSSMTTPPSTDPATSWRSPPVPPSPSTRPLVIKKKSSGVSPLSHSFASDVRKAFRREDSNGGISTSSDGSLSNGELEKRVNQVVQRNIDSFVEKRVDALLAAKLKEAGVTDSSGPRTPVSQSSNTSENAATDREGDLVDRIAHLEDQFVRINDLLSAMVPARRQSNTRIPSPIPRSRMHSQEL